jgi:hypothetical protein
VEIGERGSGELLWALAKAASNKDVTITRVFFKGASLERAVVAGEFRVIGSIDGSDLVSVGNYRS